MLRFFGLFLSLSLVCAGTLQAREAPAMPVVSRHSLQLDDSVLDYTAEAGRIAIRDVETERPHGYMFYTAYRIASPTRARPIIFIWNGGPGADSSTLHFQVAGPKRLAGDQLIDNPQTWLESADLVFVDPIGTGFSRLADAKYADEFYGTLGDVSSVAEFVRAWLLLNGAEDNPVYLAGESWGAVRAANVGFVLQKRGIPTAGLALISGGAGLTSDPVPSALGAALRVVDYARTSRTHGKLSKDVTEAEIETWARGAYRAALERVESLPSAERDAVAATLARYTGLPASKVDRQTLTIFPRLYRTELLADQGKTIGLFDMRLIGSDPMGEGSAAILHYFRRDLGYRTDSPYLGLEAIEQGYAPNGNYPEPVNSRWNYATIEATPEAYKEAVALAQRTGAGPPRIGPSLPGTAELVALNPAVRVIVAAGMYDSLASCAKNDEIARRLAGGLAEAVTFKCYAGGHMMYRDDATRIAFSRDIAALVAR